MKKQFAFFYFMKKEIEEIRLVVPSHIKYWEKCNLKKYSGGPFSDRSGGLITFEAENREEATTIIMNDPFILKNLIEDKWIKEWIVE
jgi:uncharacterized protein YciI